MLLLDAGRVIGDGSARDVLDEERIGALYDAKVRVVREEREIFVLPERRR